MSTPNFVFVGERQSPKAALIGATWQNRRMASRTLCNALISLGIEPNEQNFVNLWDEPGLRKPAHGPKPDVLDYLRGCSGVIVGMGRIVQAELDKAGIPYRAMVHPAARGAIRRTDRFLEHMRTVLVQEVTP